MSTIKTYSELITFPTFEERFKYCQTNQHVSEETFGSHRYLNQRFYKSPEWRKIRQLVIIRDNGCDLACPDYPIAGVIYIHHLNPMQIEDIINRKEYILLMEFLICASFNTHQALHYEYEPPQIRPVVRTPNDTSPWLEV